MKKKKKVFFSFIVLFTLQVFLLPGLVFAKIPDDPRVKQWSYKDIGAYKAWDITTGSHDVVVAVIDNGFDSSHPDIRENVWKNTDEIANNGIDDDNNGYIDDSEGWNFVMVDKNGNHRIDKDEKKGNNNPVPDVTILSDEEKEQGYFNHGTLVAGLIGATGNNKIAGAGLNWKIQLMNLKVLANSGIGDFAPLAEAIYYAVDNGADIINISAVGNSSTGLKNALGYAYEHGVVVVAAAGNNSASLNEEPLYPACSDRNLKVQKVLGVSAIDESHRLASFSNYGDDCIDITAPGVNIGTTIVYNPKENLKNQFRDGWNGTSFATPLVSGAAALIKSVQPDWKAPQIYDALLKNTHKTPPSDDAMYKNLFGAGLLQVDKAVQYAIDQLPMVRKLNSLLVFESNSGVLKTITPGAAIQSVSKSFLRKVSDVATFEKNGNSFYFTRRPFQGNDQITIYDQQWQKINRWSLPLDPNKKIQLGKFFNLPDTNIFILPKNISDPIVVYSTEGKKILEKKLSLKGEIVLMNLLPQTGSDQNLLALVIKENNKNILKIFDSNLLEKQNILFSSFGTVQSLGTGDFNGDRELDYALLSQKEQNLWITILSQKGKVLKRFVLDSLQATSVNFTVGDFNTDKKDDIITLDSSGNIQVWDFSGTLVQTVKTLFESSFNNFSLIVSS